MKRENTEIKIERNSNNQEAKRLISYKNKVERIIEEAAHEEANQNTSKDN